MKFDVRVFFDIVSRKFKFQLNRSRITGTLRKDLSSSVIVSRLVLLTMRNVSDKVCRENSNTNFMFNNVFFFFFPKIFSFAR
jgi:hypothetical protein